LWWAQKRAGAEGEARAVLREAAGLLEEESWAEALRAARQAQGVLAGVGADPGLRRQARTLIADLEMARQLQEARLQGAAVKDGRFDTGATDAAYAAAFQEYALDVDRLDPQAAAEQIRARPIHAQLVAALDDWACAQQQLNAVGWKQRLAVARAADPDAWRNRLRDVLESTDGKTLEEVVAAGPVGDWAVPTLVLLATVAPGSASGDRVTARLGQAQQRHPDDFWINEKLGERLCQAQPPRLAEAIRFYSVAVALRPQSPGVHNNLAYALRKHGRLDEAIVEYREALRLRPDLPEVHSNFGLALAENGRFEEAIAEFLEAIRLNKDDAVAHSGLGAVLREKGRLDEAIAECREAIRINKDDGVAHANLGSALQDKGQLDEAIAEHRQAIQINKDDFKAHNNLGRALRQKGRLDEAIAECREAIRIKWDHANAHVNLGLALKDRGRLDEAIAECREAIRINKENAVAHVALGNALAGKGRHDEEIAEYREAIRIKKDYAEAHYNLGHALADLGRLDEALAEYRETIWLSKDDAEAHCNLGCLLDMKGQFAEALVYLRRGHELGSRNPRWRYPSAEWVKDCERQLELDGKLPAILSGQRQPADIAERLALAQLCQRQCKKRYAAAARFYGAAFAEKPQLAHDLGLQHRYKAACAAALAGCGQGEDAAKLDTNEHVGLRKQASNWLRADLQAYRQLLDKSAGKSGPEIVRQMQHWLQDTDFTGVRGHAALSRLPEPERGDWQKLWEEVEALRQRSAKSAQPADPAQP
jgi:tetratricopeptide (TPR) repeat protein